MAYGQKAPSCDLLSKLSEKLKNALKFKKGPTSWLVDQNMQKNVLINNSWTAWTTKLLNAFFEVFDNSGCLYYFFFIKGW